MYMTIQSGTFFVQLYKTMKLSEFINLCYKYIGGNTNQADYVLYLISKVMREPETAEEDKEDDENKYNPLSNFKSNALSKIFSGERSITKKDAITIYRKFDKTRIEEEIEALNDDKKNELINDLGKYGFISVRDKLHETISEIANVILKKLSEGNKNGANPNDVNQYDSELNKNDFLYILETDSKCPLCFSPLYLNKTKTTLWKYKIVKIYPINIEPELQNKFNRIKDCPDCLESYDNNIALCRDCADEYIIEPNLETYSRLIEIKRQLKNKEKLNAIMIDEPLEENIRKIIQGLNNFQGNFGIPKYKLNAKKIANKIKSENYILMSDIKHKVATFYKLVEKEFQNINWVNGGSFQTVSGQINLSYIRLRNLGMGQNEIFTKLSEWICKKLKLDYEKYKTASEILVAFFVQNCEVFDEIAK